MSDDRDSDSEDECGEDRGEILRQIEAYHQSFPEILGKKMEKDRIAEKKFMSKYEGIQDDDLLREELDSIKKRVSGATVIKDVGALIVAGSYVLQKSCLFGLKLDGPKIGLADIVKSNEGAFNSVMKEIACKYNLNKFMEPELRAVLLAVQCVGMCHLLNSKIEDAPVAKTEEVKHEPAYTE